MQFLKKFFQKEKTVDNPKELHGAMQAAIQNVSGKTDLKASGKWAAKFLADRIMTLLKNNVKYTSAGGEEVIQKEMTQKEFKQALNKALEQAPETPEAATEEPTEDSTEDENVETVYIKAADLDSEDSELQKAFNKLPDKEMSWEEVLKTVGMSKGLALIDAGGLTEMTKDVEKEQEYGSELNAPEFDDDDSETRGYESEFDRTMRDIDSYRTTRSFDGNSWD
jgi:flagellar hook-basal body complex protein FliE